MVTLMDTALIVTTLACGLVAGLVWGFSVVVMPGIAKLSDKDFLLAFKHMDAVIQNRQPMFMLVWVGSVASALVTLALGTMQLSGAPRQLMWFACGLYLVAVQGPTIRFNIPLNNAVQALNIEGMNDKELVEARARFEAPWNRWNQFRTWAAVFSVVALVALQTMLR